MLTSNVRTYAAAFVCALGLSACGGGGGGPTGGPPGGGIAFVPTSPPSPPSTQSFRMGDVKVVAQVQRGASVAYDTDDGTVLYDVFNNRGIFSILPTTYNSVIIPNGIAAMFYSSSQHALYVATNSAIYRVVSGGQPTLIASGFQEIFDLTVDPSGNVYVIDNDHVSTVVSGAPKPLSSPGSVINPDTTILSSWPHIAFDSSDGNLYVTDPGRDAVERVTTEGATSVLSGTCVASGPALPCALSNIPGTGSGAVFAEPAGIVYDAAANLLYVEDEWNNELWTITPGGRASIVAGYGPCDQVDANGLAAFLCDPIALAFDPNSGLLYLREGAGESFATYATAGTAAPAYFPPTLRFMMPTIAPATNYLATASDASAWVAEQTVNRLAHVASDGTVHEYPMPATWMYPAPIVVDASGNAWAGARQVPGPIVQAPALVRFDTSGQTTVFPLAAADGAIVTGLTIGSDGNVWFSKRTMDGGTVGFIDPDGAITEYALTSYFDAPYPQTIVQGPDGNMWFSMPGGPGIPPNPATNNVVARVTESGQFLAAFPMPVFAIGMAYDASDAKVWFVDGNSSVGKIAADGTVTTFATVNSSDGNPAEPTEVTIAPDGTPWITEVNENEIARVDEAGHVTSYLLPQNGPGLFDVGARPDGKIWASGMIGAMFLLDPAAYDASSLPRAVGRRPSDNRRR